MTPSQIRMIAFFFDYNLPVGPDRIFINNLECKEVTYELTDPEPENLFRIYDDHAPDKGEDEWHHIKKVIQTLKDIEYMQIKFQLHDGSEAFDTEIYIP